VEQFTEAQVDDAIDFVIRNGAHDRGQTVSYSRLFEAAGLPAPQELHQGGDPKLVTEFMEAFQARCEEMNLPPLDALIVHVAGPRRDFPGAGYFRVNGQPDPVGKKAGTAEEVVQATTFWEAEKDECRRWGATDRRRRRRSGP